MKLADYAMRQHIEAQEWRDATELVVGHFGLQMPPDYDIEFTDRAWTPEAKVIVCHDKRYYVWDSEHGFYKSERTNTKSGAYARFYLPVRQ